MGRPPVAFPAVQHSTPGALLIQMQCEGRPLRCPASEPVHQSFQGPALGVYRSLVKIPEGFLLWSQVPGLGCSQGRDPHFSCYAVQPPHFSCFLSTHLAFSLLLKTLPATVLALPSLSLTAKHAGGGHFAWLRM